MPRLTRAVIPSVPYHVTRRCNHLAVVFHADEDGGRGRERFLNERRNKCGSVHGIQTGQKTTLPIIMATLKSNKKSKATKVRGEYDRGQS